MKTTDPADIAPLPPTVPAGAVRAVDDDGDDWLGCEAMHPLTWLPMAASADGAPRLPVS